MTERAGRPAPMRLPGHRAFARLWELLHPFVGHGPAPFVAFLATAVVSAFGEATLLYLVVKAATAIAAGDDSVEIAVGPFERGDVGLSHLFALHFALLAVLIVVTVLNAVIAARLSASALTNARTRTFDAFLDAGWDAQARERDGRIQELVTTYAKKISTGVMTFTQGLTAAVSFTAFFAAAVVVSPVAAVTIAVGAVGLYLLLRPVTRLTRSRSRANLAANSAYAISVAEAASFTREIRAFDVTEPVRRDIDGVGADAARLTASTRLLEQLTPNLYQQAALLLVVAGMFGIWLRSVGDVTNLGAVVLLLVRGLTYSQQLQAAVQRANEIAPYAEALEQHRRHYLAHPSRTGSIELRRWETLRFERVSFHYDAGTPVLQGVDFAIRPGETIGIVGPSGSGKSTLVQLLLRLREPSGGAYLIGDTPATAFSRGSWARQVAFVPQENRLLRATVADNIRFHRASLDEAAVRRAAEVAGLDAEIQALPDGYDTVVGSGARDLSGGQRQRLGLARALAGEPSMLVLDEPTSALDMRSEALIQSALARLHGRLTLFIVAHRVTTLSRCDRIMVLGGGRIQDFADHDTLKVDNEFFRDATRLSGVL